MPSQVNFAVRDYSDELSNVQFNIEDWDETTLPAVKTAIASIRAAILALSIGNIAHETLSDKTVVNDVRPTSKYAQREQGLRMFYQDTGNFKKYHITIPCANNDLLAVGGTDEVNIEGNVLVAALVTVLEGFMKAPTTGNDIQFYKAVLVGRAS